MSIETPRPTADASPIIRLNNAAIEIQHLDIDADTRIERDPDGGHMEIVIDDCDALPPEVLSTLGAYRLRLKFATRQGDGIQAVII